MNKTRLGLYTFFCSAIAIALAIGINLLATLLPENIKLIDTSSSDILSLSDATINYVDELKNDVSIYLISEKSAVDQTVLNVLKRYDALSDKISIETVDPIARPAFIAKYSQNELENNSLIIVSGERFKVINSYSLFSFKVFGSTDGTNIDSYSNMSYSDFSRFYEENSVYFENYLTYGVGYGYEMLFDGEKIITSSIDYVVSDSFPSVYYTIGHGESELSESILSALHLDNVNCEALSIATKKLIPDDCSLLVIASPVSDLSESETQIISDFLKNGGKLFLITSYNCTELSNLSSITESFGMKAEKSIISETDGNYIFSQNATDILPITKNADKFLSIDARYLIMPKAHPIVRTQNAEDGELDIKVTFSDLFVSSQSSVLANADDQANTDDEQVKKSYTVGMLAKSGDSAILWISSSEFLDESINVSSAGGNYIYATALIENLCEKNSPFSIASKLMVEDSLTITSAQAGFWAIVIVVIIPMTFIICGTVIYQKRRKR